MGLGKLWELVMDREAWHAAVHGFAKSRIRVSDWTELNCTSLYPFLPFKIRRLQWGTDVCGCVPPQITPVGGIDWSIVWTCAPSKSVILLTWNWPTTTSKKDELYSAAPVRSVILRVLVVSSKEWDLHKVSQSENGWVCAREDGERLCGHFNFGF